jgi:hypothetical protein
MLERCETRASWKRLWGTETQSLGRKEGGDVRRKEPLDTQHWLFYSKG